MKKHTLGMIEHIPTMNKALFKLPVDTLWSSQDAKVEARGSAVPGQTAAKQVQGRLDYYRSCLMGQKQNKTGLWVQLSDRALA